MQEKIGDQPNPVGGFSKEKIALRRAIAMAYKIDDQIRIIRKGQAIKAEFPIPPGVAGHDPNYKSSIQYDPQTANALLDKFGYKKGTDGYRSLPDGKPLVIRYSSRPTERDRQFDELVKALARFDRNPGGDPQGPLSRVDQAGQTMPAHDARRSLDCRLPGRRQLHAIALRPEYRTEQQRVLSIAGIRQALQKVEGRCPTARSATSSIGKWRA